MKTLHIADKNVLRSFVPHMDEVQWLDLPNGQVVVACAISDPNVQSAWTAHPAVVSFPSLLSSAPVLSALSANAALSAELAAFDLTSTDTTLTLFEKLQKVHPLMKP